MFRLFLCFLFILAGCSTLPETMRSWGNPKVEAPVAAPAVAPPAPPSVSAPIALKVGLLVPLSGQHSALGRAMQDAALLALQDKIATLSPDQRARTSIVLIPKDTEVGAAKAMTAALDEGAHIILGPIFSADVVQAAPVAAARNIPVLAFSNNPALAKPGLYVLGFQPEQQVERIVGFAAAQKITRIATLLPQDAYGQGIAASVQDTIKRKGLTLTNAQWYTRTATDPKAQLQAIFASNPQALLIPEGGDRLNAIALEITAMGLDKKGVRLLGSGQWDDEKVLLSSSLNGHWFSGAQPESRQLFARRFLQHYTYAPDRLSSLAYDAMALVSTLALNAPAGVDAARALSAEALTNPSGFAAPVDGLLRLLPSGLSERGLAVLAVGVKPQIVEKAPTHFNN
jgi:branched-chain amino acid transport system substrate-binding protein